jgi:hypothetical protein
MMFPVPAAIPPTSVLNVPERTTPNTLGSAVEPSGRVPMMLP